MLNENNIFFSEEDRNALIDSTQLNEEYKIRTVYIVIKDINQNIEWVKRIYTYEWFVEILQKSNKIECVNDTCSIVKFIDFNGNEIEQLSTTEELGSALSSNPDILFGYGTFIKK